MKKRHPHPVEHFVLGLGAWLASGPPRTIRSRAELSFDFLFRCMLGGKLLMVRYIMLTEMPKDTYQRMLTYWLTAKRVCPPRTRLEPAFWSLTGG